MIPIRTLLLSALAVLMIGLMFHGGNFREMMTLENIFTWVILAIFWVLLGQWFERSRTDSGSESVEAPQSMGMREEDESEEAGAPQQGAVYHQLPWQVTQQGSSLGRFRDLPIPAWIETSDGRRAEYSGTVAIQMPEECRCLEFPKRGELILPPGLVYLINRQS
ncbi:MAG: hypothetical protein HQL63_01945 [Magnetococcales bacterium]|nr:hypothetical protein [Magnetococcales bacterium]MBF0323364.1 hypothetical protein [Magnetococcales bacterium]